MSGRRRAIIVFIVVFIVVLLTVLFFIFNRFDGYTEDSSIQMGNAQRTQYVDINGKLMSYNLDGAIMMDYNGALRWTISYEMQDPRIDIKNTCALIYDKQGTMMKIVTNDGQAGEIRTTLPITAACISEQQNVAVVMQEEDTAYLKVFKSSGETVATGELKLTDSGYPLALALSSDGSRMAVSTLHLLEGKVKSEVIFYDFSKTGSSYENNKVGAFSYSDMIIPQIAYIENDKLLMLGDSEIVVFGNQTQPKPETEMFFSSNIKSVFFNNKYIAVIVNETGDDGTIKNQLSVYSTRGHRRFSKIIEKPYNTCEILKGNEIMLTDGHSMELYSILGVHKFSYQFNDEVHRLIPASGYKSYYLFQGDKMSKIHLR